LQYETPLWNGKIEYALLLGKQAQKIQAGELFLASEKGAFERLSINTLLVDLFQIRQDYAEDP
jgi:hypothetical protein